MDTDFTAQLPGSGKHIIRPNAYEMLLKDAILGNTPVNNLNTSGPKRHLYLEAVGDIHNFIYSKFKKVGYEELKMDINGEFQKLIKQSLKIS